jgi:hypothetical protein
MLEALAAIARAGATSSSRMIIRCTSLPRAIADSHRMTSGAHLNVGVNGRHETIPEKARPYKPLDDVAPSGQEMLSCSTLTDVSP